MKLPFQKPPSSICILRLSAIGDVTHVVPVVRTVQHHWPETKITWIIGKLEATLVGDLPGVDFVVFDKSRGWKALMDLRKQLSQKRFDILLNMQVAFRASMAGLMVKSPIKLGFDKERARDNQWLFTNAKIAPNPRKHVLDGFFDFLTAMGIEDRNMVWDIPIPDAAKNFAIQHIPPNVPVLAINPCSSNRARNWRNWRVEYYAELANYAHDSHGMTVVLTGGPDDMERRYAEEIMAACSHPPINLVGKTRLKELLAVLDRAQVILSPDTGPAHMGTAVGTPVIGLYASSNPYRTGPYLSLPLVVNQYPASLMRAHQLDVETARWGKRVRDPQVMDWISPKDVKLKLDEAMAQSSKVRS